MAKKSKGKTTKRRATKAAAPSCKVGDLARVRSGDYGNAVGYVDAVRGSKVLLRMGREVHEFDAVNVERGGPKDRF